MDIKNKCNINFCEMCWYKKDDLDTVLLFDNGKLKIRDFKKDYI